MDFAIEQTFAAEPDAVAWAYTEPGLYALIGEASPLGRPEVLDRSEEDGGADEVVHLQIRYRFTGDLSPAASAVLDPARLTWVEHSEHHLGRRHVAYRLVPDHYADRFRAAGDCRVGPRAGPAPAGHGAVRLVRGSLTVRARIMGGAVERAIISGLRAHLRTEARAVERFLAGSDGAQTG